VHGNNKAFANLKPESEHDVLYIKYCLPWVQGVGAEVPLYDGEYCWVDQTLLLNVNDMELGFVGGDRLHSKSDCKKCAAISFCDEQYVLPCTYDKRNDGLNGHFVNL
jgi:hypothetical protein